MRKLLNTLYVTTPEAYLTKDGENVVIRVKEKDIFRIPVLNIEGIVTFANKSLEISRLFIAGKIANSRTVIDRFKRDHISSDKQLSLFLSVSEKLKRSKMEQISYVTLSTEDF